MRTEQQITDERKARSLASTVLDPRSTATRKHMKLTKAQRTALLWAKRKYKDGRVPPYVFRDYRSLSGLIETGLIEPWLDYGAPMYKFTHKGLDALGGQ